MTRTLILTRHAKSSWDTAGLDDHSRPLNKRGTLAAKALGNWMRQRGWLPDQVLSSSAQRTRETCAGMALDVQPEFLDTLYHVTANQLLRVLSGASGQTVLMLGHNPGVGEFAEGLVSEPPDHPRFSDYPTGATTVVQFDIDGWDQMQWRRGKVVDFVVPRDLQT